MQNGTTGRPTLGLAAGPMAPGAGPDWLPVVDAAAQLGISERTTRKWIARGRLTATRTAEGWRVLLPAAQGPAETGPETGPAAPETGPGPAAEGVLVAQLQSEVEFLRDQVRALQERLREAHLLAAQRPALPAPAPDQSDRGADTSLDVLPKSERPWWRRLFG
jgi:excisionase family DNA binding protein